MFAIRQYRFGAPETLEYEEVPDPVAGPGQVRIRVEAAGVHLLDTSIRRGTSGGPFPLPTLPMTPGREVAGTVDAVGSDADRAWIGKRVVAHLGQASGGYAELAVGEVQALHEIPSGVTARHAVAMIGTGRTALAILEAAPITPTDVVIVPAAAGGIGALLVQAGLNVDALVVGLAGGPQKLDHVRRLGAHIAVNYRDPAWPDTVSTLLDGVAPSIVFDTVGGDVGHAAMTMLRPGGTLVLAGSSAGQPTQITTRDIIGGGLTVTATIGPRLMSRRGGLREFETAALTAVAGGVLVPLVNAPFALADAAGAHAALESRGTVGKVVLVPKEGEI